MTTRPFGLPGLGIEPGDHICAFFRGADERDALLYPFLEAGLGNGERCYALVDTISPADVRATIAERTGDSPGAQLTVSASTSAYCPPEGFSPDVMIAVLAANLAQALEEEGYDFVRTLGEMTSTITGQMSPLQLIAYEVAVNHYLPTHPQVAFCLYDVDRFDGGTILDMIRVHPKVLLNGEIIENPYFTLP
jgi:hypothetical protein